MVIRRIIAGTICEMLVYLHFRTCELDNEEGVIVLVAMLGIVNSSTHAPKAKYPASMQRHQLRSVHANFEKINLFFFFGACERACAAAS